MPWGLSCQLAGVTKIVLCAKYGDTKIEPMEVDKTKRHCRFLRPRQWQETWKQGLLKSWQGVTAN